MSNGSKYSITYANPTVNDLNVIKITAVGTSADNTASRQVSHVVKFVPTVFRSTTVAMTAKGTISLSGSSMITNTQNAYDN